MSDLAPRVNPDYSGATIPCNIAPLNFAVKEKGKAFLLKIETPAGKDLTLHSRKGAFKIPASKWRRILAANADTCIRFRICIKDKKTWKEYRPMTVSISSDSVSPYIVYRDCWQYVSKWASTSDALKLQNSPMIVRSRSMIA
jgi:hypothetical protein